MKKPKNFEPVLKLITLVVPVRLLDPIIWTPAPIILDGVEIGMPIYHTRLLIPDDEDVLLQQINRTQRELIRESWPGEGLGSKNLNNVLWPLRSDYQNTLGLDKTSVIYATAPAGKPPTVVNLFDTLRCEKGHYVPQSHTGNALNGAIYSGCECWVTVLMFTYWNTPSSAGVGAQICALGRTKRALPEFPPLKDFSPRPTEPQTMTKEVQSLVSTVEFHEYSKQDRKVDLPALSLDGDVPPAA